MGDGKLMDTNQIINGIAVLLSFFVGYKYAVKKHDLNNGGESKTDETDKGSETTDSASFHGSYHGNYKMVLVVRNDLKMGKGKIAAQCGHGAVGAYQKAMRICPRTVRAWDETGCAKIALKVESEAELRSLKRAAEGRNVVTCLVHDAGRTQIAPNTRTVLAIGPARADDIDRITGHLKLL